MAALVIICIICAFVGLAIGHGKGRGLAGFLLGLFLGIIGWIITACLKPSHEALVQQQVALREAARDADALMARRPEGLDALTSSNVLSMTHRERHAYVKTGEVPERLAGQLSG